MDWYPPVKPCNDCGAAVLHTPENGGWCEKCLRNYSNEKPSKDLK